MLGAALWLPAVGFVGYEFVLRACVVPTLWRSRSGNESPPTYVKLIVDWSTELADPAVQTELRTALTSALEELPDHYSAVIILHDVSGHVDWTPAEKLAAFSTVPAAV